MIRFSRTLPAFAVAALAVHAFGAHHEILGNWDITIGEPPRTQPSWIGIEWKDGKHLGRFLGTAGSVGNPEPVKFENPIVEFDAHGWHWKGTVKGDTIEGMRKNDRGEEQKWTAKRFERKPVVRGTWMIKKGLPGAVILRDMNGRIGGAYRAGRGREDRSQIQDATLKGDDITIAFKQGQASEATTITATIKGDVMEGKVTRPGGTGTAFVAQRQRQWGEPVELFNGKNLDGWKLIGGQEGFGNWQVQDGLMINTAGGPNIQTIPEFQDFKLHVEFRVPEGGNSGVYLRGRHEIQVADSFGHKPDSGSCGSLYSRIVASKNASRPAGEWQTYDITLIGSYVNVVHNGETIIDNQKMEGITGGALDSNEGAPGPIYLQGDHTAVDYRKLTLTPAGEPILPAGGRGNRNRAGG